MPTTFQILPVRWSEDLAATARLFEAYESSLDIDLSYQDFAAELAALPGKYAPPAGELLLARDNQGTPLGCVGLRPLPDDDCCEMKRLYVAPSARGSGLGKELVEAIIREGRRIGYREMRLDSFPSMAAALTLYRAAGFAPIPPYYETPAPETIFLALKLPS